MQTSPAFQSQFAPAERAPQEQVLEEYAQLSQHGLLKKFLDAIFDIVVVLNPYRQIVFINHIGVKYLHIDDLHCILGMRPGEAFNCIRAGNDSGGCGTTEFCQTCGAVKAILTAQSGVESVQECRIIINESQDALDLRVIATPLTLEQKQYTIFTVTDISNEKRRQALERIFFHDVMNTAGGIHGFSELLASAPVNEVPELGNTLRYLSDDLIEEIKTQRILSEAEKNEYHVDETLIQSRQFIERLIQLYLNHKIKRNRVLKLHHEIPLVVFVSDGTILRRVLGNMIKNALEASQEGDEVTVGLTTEGDRLEFWVQNPRFIPREIQLQIFQRSFSTKGTGRGLGTYSMKLLGERYLGGRVTFTSTLDDGTCFKLNLPLKR